MFSKAKLKRFNEEVGCAPPPTAYNPKLEKKVMAAVSLDKSERWRECMKDTPGPGAYAVTAPSFSSTNTPRKKMASSSSSGRLNSSVCSNVSSTSSGGVFLSPRMVGRASSSVRGTVGAKGEELQAQIKDLTQERDQLKTDIVKLELRLAELQGGRNSQSVDTMTDAEEVFPLHRTSEGGQTDGNFPCNPEEANADTSPPPPPPPPPSPSSSVALKEALNSTREELRVAQLTITQLTATQQEEKQSSESSPSHIKEQVDHLTLLRDNLEASLLHKEDLIAELRLQLDEVVAESEEQKRHLEASLEESCRGREEVEGRVQGLVAQYEALARQQSQERECHREELVKKDIEIELLNGSLSSLNAKVSEYEETLSSLQAEVSERGSKISQLEATLEGLNGTQRERDEKEQQLLIRSKEISKLEESLVEVEGERRGLLSTLEEERARVQELKTRVHQMEVVVKEKEVLQQFLEKEIAAREEEVSQSSTRIQELEGELETVRRVALDLQEEAEAKLNQMLTLQATVSAKEYDLEAKTDLITSLQQEMSQKANETMSLQERFEVQMSLAAKVEDDLLAKRNQVETLAEELVILKKNLTAKEECLSNAEERTAHLEESNSHLEEKLVELMAKMGDREAHYVARMNGLEGELDELGVKYSEALLEHEATRRVLTQASEELEKESLVRLAAERELCSVKEELQQCLEEKVTADTHLKDLVRKYTNLEDALACEEAENRDLEERLEEARSAAAAVHSELATAQVATEGFKTQITQLKIDMRKKCDAVEEMQQCIETLREEKQHLTSLRDNLEETVASLRLQAASIEREAEEERISLRSRISDLENHLKEAEEQVEKEKVKVVSAKEELCRLEEDHTQLEEREREEVRRVAQLTAKVEELEAGFDGYKDQLKNLETSLQDKTMKLEAQRQEMKATTALQTTANTLRQEVEALNTTLTTKTTQLDTLTTSLTAKDQELQALKKVADERERDLQTIITLREDLEATKEALTRLEEEKEDTATLRKEMEDWKAKFLHLENMIEPFRAQLDAYEVEKNSLMEQSSAAKDEMDKLSRQYATLLGHQNHKQKIHHVRQLKIDNNALREEVHKLRQEADRQRKTVRRLEDKLLKASFGGSSSSLTSTSKLADTTRLCVGDKENNTTTMSSASSTSFFEAPPSLASTPLKPSNRTHHRL